MALAIGLIGLALTRRSLGVKTAFVFLVALAATLVPLAWEGLDVAEVCNWAFYAASTCCSITCSSGRCGGFPGRSPSPDALGRGDNRPGSRCWRSPRFPRPAEETPEIAAKETPRVNVELVPPAPVAVPDDVLIRPYDLQPDGGIDPSDRLLVPYAKYVELWNRAHPDKKLSEGEGAAAAVRLGRGVLCGDAQRRRRPAIDGANGDRRVRRRVCRRADGVARRGALRARTSTASPPASGWPVSPPNRSRSKRPCRTTPWRRSASKGRGGTALEMEIQVKLSRQGGWRVAEAALPAAPATGLAITAPAAGTEIRLSQAP